jgi:phage/plasmid-like protein (TIGR03299 family)
MSHEITQREDGTAEAAYALTPAWHGLGTVVDHAMTSQEALQFAHLDWRVIQEPVFQEIPSDTNQYGIGKVDPDYVEVPNLKLNVREDNGVILGAVSDAYSVCQNVQGFQFLDNMFMDGILKYESAMSLKGGKQVIILARAPQDFVIKGEDKVSRYFLFSMYHDGTGGIVFGACSTRVVCKNTFRMAEMEKSVQRFSHVGDISAKLERAQEKMRAMNHELQVYEDRCKRLADRVISTDEWNSFLDVVVPIPLELDPNYTKQRRDNLISTRKLITKAYGNERQRMPGIGSTAWAAFNAVTEHVDHLPRRGADENKRQEARFNVTMYGTGHNVKARAYKTACKLAGMEA